MQVLFRTIIMSSVLIVFISNAQEVNTELSKETPDVPTNPSQSDSGKNTPTESSSGNDVQARMEQAVQVPESTQDIGSASVIDQFKKEEHTSDAQPSLPEKPVSAQSGEKPLEFPPQPQEQKIVQPSEPGPIATASESFPTSTTTEQKQTELQPQELKVTQETPAQPSIPTESTSTESMPVQNADTQTEQTPISVEIPSIPTSSEQPQLKSDQAQSEILPTYTKEIKPTDSPMPTDQPQLEQQTEEDQELEIKGLDTVDLPEPQGNWLFKRIWWERAEDKFEKIRAAVDAILESRLQLFAKRVSVERDTLDPFFINTGLGQGEMEEVLSQLITYLQGIKEEDIKQFDNKNLLASLLEEKKNLEQLKQDVQLIITMNDDLDVVLTKIIEQINKMRVYEEEAWKAFKEISRVLNDKRARELFYIMNTYARNINDIQIYIDKTLSQHFEGVVTKINNLIAKVAESIKALKEKGIDFKKQTEEIQNAERERLSSCPIEEKEVQAEPTAQQEGVVAAIGSYVGSIATSVWNGIKYVIQWPIELFFGKQGPKTEAELDRLEQEEQITSDNNKPQIETESEPSIKANESSKPAPEQLPSSLLENMQSIGANEQSTSQPSLATETINTPSVVPTNTTQSNP